MRAAAHANASTITFSGEIHTGNSELFIHNMADANFSITRVTVTLGHDTVFSTSPAPSIDDTVTVAHFGSHTGVLDDPTDYPTASAFNTGYQGPLSSDLVQGVKVATFTFDDFPGGEAWSISIDYDTAGGGRPAWRPPGCLVQVLSI